MIPEHGRWANCWAMVPTPGIKPGPGLGGLLGDVGECLEVEELVLISGRLLLLG